MTAAALAASIIGCIGLFGAMLPSTWIGLFTYVPEVHVVAARYLVIVGLAYPFLGLGLTLASAFQAAGRSLWPLLGITGRALIVAIGGRRRSLRPDYLRRQSGHRPPCLRLANLTNADKPGRRLIATDRDRLGGGRREAAQALFRDFDSRWENHDKSGRDRGGVPHLICSLSVHH